MRYDLIFFRYSLIMPLKYKDLDKDFSSILRHDFQPKTIEIEYFKRFSEYSVIKNPVPKKSRNVNFYFDWKNSLLQNLDNLKKPQFDHNLDFYFRIPKSFSLSSDQVKNAQCNTLKLSPNKDKIKFELTSPTYKFKNLLLFTKKTNFYYKINWTLPDTKNSYRIESFNSNFAKISYPEKLEMNLDIGKSGNVNFISKIKQRKQITPEQIDVEISGVVKKSCSVVCEKIRNTYFDFLVPKYISLGGYLWYHHRQNPDPITAFKNIELSSRLTYPNQSIILTKSKRIDNHENLIAKSIVRLSTSLYLTTELDLCNFKLNNLGFSYSDKYDGLNQIKYTSRNPTISVLRTQKMKFEKIGNVTANLGFATRLEELNPKIGLYLKIS